MNDRELLELAAKAAGYNVRWCLNGVEGDERECFVFVENGLRWEPQDDDGDALRLAVKLALDVEMHGCTTVHPYASARKYEYHIAEEEQPNNGDPYTATRRVIVRAAAEIGKAMP